MTRIRVYCDGSSGGGAGGWGVFIEDPDGQKRSFSGYELDTTNNQMELLAVIQALNHLSPASSLMIICDSEYVLNGITIYIHRWKKNGWITADGNAVKNRDLWEELDAKCKGRDIQWYWTRGHAHDLGNIEADRLAGAARKAAKGS